MSLVTENDPLWKKVLQVDLKDTVDRMVRKGLIERNLVAFGLRDYRRWLYVLVRNFGEIVVPTKLIDLFWHEHILDTRKYARDCRDLLEGTRLPPFLHHNPSVMPGTPIHDEGIAARNRLLDAYFGSPAFALDPTDNVACDGEDCA